MTLPLPNSYQAPLAPGATSANMGLIFDRGAFHWDEKYVANPAPVVTFLQSVQTGARTRAALPLLQDVLERRSQLIRYLKGREFQMTSVWRLVSGLGMAHVLQNGFVWDRNLGVPFLPGSTIKGAIRAWAEQSNTYPWEELKLFFGDSEDLGAGHIIVHDALPVKVPQLESDVMAVHVPGYYRSPGTAAPVDYESPNIITFLTVPAETTFSFAVSARPGVKPLPDLTIAETLCATALEKLGVGAKTAIGYGYFI